MFGPLKPQGDSVTYLALIRQRHVFGLKTVSDCRNSCGECPAVYNKIPYICSIEPGVYREKAYTTYNLYSLQRNSKDNRNGRDAISTLSKWKQPNIYIFACSIDEIFNNCWTPAGSAMRGRELFQYRVRMIRNIFAKILFLAEWEISCRHIIFTKTENNCVKKIFTKMRKIKVSSRL